MAIKRRKHPKPPRVQRECSVDGCPVIHNRLAMCTKHESRLRRYGSPTGTALKDHELAPYRLITEALFHKHEAHPAIVAAHERMQDILDNYGRDSAMATVGRKARPFLDTLLSHGATPRSCLVECAAVSFRWSMEERAVTTAQMEMQLASRLLLSKSTGTRGNNRTAWTRRIIGSLGYQLRCEFCTLFLQMHRVWKADEDKRDEQLKAMRTFTP
jgi:hypothetical protein